MGKLVVFKTCKECNQPFGISEGEVRFLNEHKLAMFERCHDCRKKRREEREAQAEKETK